MADAIEFRITGLDELRGKLQELSDDVRKKGGRSSLRKAAKTLADKVRQNALAIDDPKTAESISKNIAERWNGRLNKRTGGDDIGFRIGVLGGARDYSAYGELKTGKKATENPGRDTFYWRFVEFGTSRVMARPFIRPVIDQNGQDAINVFFTEYNLAMDRALKRARKKRSS